MRAGDLRQLIMIEQRSDAPDALGQPIATWSPLATVRAAAEPLSGRELIAAQAVHAEVTLRLRIRHRADVTPKMRVLHQQRYYGINAVLQVSPAETHLLCSAGVVDG